MSSTDTEANFDIEQFVHTSGEGFGNDRPMDADNGSVDVAALGSVAGTPTVAGKKMSRKEKRQAKREVARLKKEAKLAEKKARKSYTSVKATMTAKGTAVATAMGNPTPFLPKPLHGRSR